MKKSILFALLAAAPFVSADDPWDPEGYVLYSTPEKKNGFDILDRITLREDEVVLDVGCGDGAITEYIAKKLPKGKVVGIDLSPKMVSYAKKTHFKENLFFEIADAACIEYEEAFDRIISLQAMQWVLDQEEALRRFQRALKPQGQLCIQMPMGLPGSMDLAIEGLLQTEDWGEIFTDFSPPWNFFLPGQYIFMLLDAGLSVIEMRFFNTDESFSTVEEFKRFLAQWLPHLRPLAEELVEVFLDQLIEAYLVSSPPDPDGTIHFVVTLMEVEAIKD